MIAREWKARCPKQHVQGFIDYLYQTGVKDTSGTAGFKGAQIFQRELPDGMSEVTLVTYWINYDVIVAFSGENISVAKLYPEDDFYLLEPDTFVRHYEVIENQWL
ncbi:antibiotic biosynthesis monooxygenase [Marinomonas sp. C2222]|uniref:Antibiotic biosynthesis monooxygenase n=1 Tax=Marinomonas sargassi TaxID=2984494 RepID=A0ABT2YQ10_9GAMM|nr:antibiotic biosynthesis monooxygenase [Marinomonas sargassi]MCV2401979.1 antibiotic biosynthesis monooxygenase [Marinomonas sargassi]